MLSGIDEEELLNNLTHNFNEGKAENLTILVLSFYLPLFDTIRSLL